MQYSCMDLGFGGVGNSGDSKINGRDGYLAFTHRKGILESGTFNGYPASLRYPPHLPSKNKTFLMIVGTFNFTHTQFAKKAKRFAVIILVLLGYRFGYLGMIYQKLKQIAQIQYNRFFSNN